MNKKYKILTLLVIAILFLGGCSNQLIENGGLNTKGNGVVSLELDKPEDSDLLKLQQTSDTDISLSSIIIKIKDENGSVIKEKDIKIADFDFDTPVALSNLPQGNLSVDVTVTDNEGKAIYKGNAKTQILDENTTKLTIKLKIAKGDLDVKVNIPTDFAAVSGSVKVDTVLDDTEQNRTKNLNLDLENGVATASFDDIKTGIWPITVTLNSDSETKSGEGQVFILPSRSALAEINLEGEGDLNINLEWENPPMPPSHLSLSYNSEKGVILNWPESESSNIAGYMVYRSMSENGRKTLLTKEAITDTSYVDKSELFEGTQYVYWVQSYSENGISGEFSLPSKIIIGEGVYFEDYTLERKIRERIGKYNGVLTKEDLNNVDELRIFDENISSLEGIQYLNNMHRLELSDVGLDNIDLLSELSNLENLYLGYNDISDISPLAKLNNLRDLTLKSNKISDFSVLRTMDNIEYLNVSENPISDFSTFINNIKHLNLDILALRRLSLDNSDLQLIVDNLAGTEMLELDRNNISDISSLTSLNNLERLTLGYNPLENPESTLAQFTQLYDLDLSGVKLDNLEFLYNYQQLERLDIGDTGITTTEMENLKENANVNTIEQLEIFDNNISSLSFITAFNNLEDLFLQSCNISDVTELEYLLEIDNLRWLDLGGNPFDYNSTEYLNIKEKLENNGVDVYDY